MRRRSLRPVPDPDERPEAYTDPDVLESLFIDRGWRRRDIADHFDITDLEVRRWLDEHEIERELKRSHAPNTGIARKLYEKGLSEATR